jgi:2-oxoglutarate/2-oxoacid ferredoxin oxidoreductase subunit beta
MSCNCNIKDYYTDELFTWCTNCGNYGIHAALKRALVEECVEPKDVAMCFDIGCHGNGSDKIGGYSVHGLHGRVLPLAAGISIANPNLKVIAFGGDGGTLSEGINHLIHTIRSNYDFIFVLHNNQNYGLTTGQASSTTPKGNKMNTAPDGVVEDPLNPIPFILSLKPNFVARGFSGDIKHTTEIFKKALNTKGFKFIEILQDCPTYNKATPHEWYMERVYDVATDLNYDSSNIETAMKVSSDMERIATGVIYENSSASYMERLENRKGVPTNLVSEVQNFDVGKLLSKFV